jgi:hypothetical protein
MRSSIRFTFQPATLGAISLAALVATVGLMSATRATIVPDSTTGCTSPNPCVGGINAGMGPGISGTNDSAKKTGPGVLGISSLSSGTEGISDDPTTGDSKYAEGGLYGSSVAQNGVYGYSGNRDGGLFENDNATFYTLDVQADATGAYIFGAQNIPDGGFARIDHLGDLTLSGSVTTNAARIYQATVDGHHVLSFGMQSTQARIEDFGSGRVVLGQGFVRLSPDFARTVDMRAGYYVFLTPMGDTKGLYVAAKSSAGFEVRESQGGRSSLSFDYRIVAQPEGDNAGRLPGFDIQRTSGAGSAPGRAPGD